jgi:hypothetical protein
VKVGDPQVRMSAGPTRLGTGRLSSRRSASDRCTLQRPAAECSSGSEASLLPPVRHRALLTSTRLTTAPIEPNWASCWRVRGLESSALLCCVTRWRPSRWMDGLWRRSSRWARGGGACDQLPRRGVLMVVRFPPAWAARCPHAVSPGRQVRPETLAARADGFPGAGDPGVEVDEAIHEVEEVDGRQPVRERVLGSEVTRIGTFSSPSSRIRQSPLVITPSFGMSRRAPEDGPGRGWASRRSP